MAFDAEINRVVRGLGDPALRVGRAMLIGAGLVVGAAAIGVDAWVKHKENGIPSAQPQPNEVLDTQAQ